MARKSTKRLRIFAGPNGSGKSTLAEDLKNHPNSHIKLGIFVNADEIERTFRQEGCFSLNKYYRFQSTTKQLRQFVQAHGIPRSIPEEFKRFSIRNNIVYYNGEYNSYVAADVAAFVRHQLMSRGKSFSFETVFSHESKLEFIKEARALGYRIYFYFVTTDDPDINVNRVNIRVEKNGHPVAEEKIRERYERAMDLLYPAIKLSDRAYLFDNSGRRYELVAEVTEGREVEVLDSDGKIPWWFMRYVFFRRERG